MPADPAGETGAAAVDGWESWADERVCGATASTGAGEARSMDGIDAAGTDSVGTETRGRVTDGRGGKGPGVETWGTVTDRTAGKARGTVTTAAAGISGTTSIHAVARADTRSPFRRENADDTDSSDGSHSA